MAWSDALFHVLRMQLACATRPMQPCASMSCMQRAAASDDDDDDELEDEMSEYGDEEEEEASDSEDEEEEEDEESEGEEELSGPEGASGDDEEYAKQLDRELNGLRRRHRGSETSSKVCR